MKIVTSTFKVVQNYENAQYVQLFSSVVCSDSVHVNLQF